VMGQSPLAACDIFELRATQQSNLEMMFSAPPPTSRFILDGAIERFFQHFSFSDPGWWEFSFFIKIQTETMGLK